MGTGMQPEGQTGGGYRPEIDGLRAIAILAVLGFHLGFGDWAGGFVGVDIFFVLSGYLICGQIYAELRAGGFSARDFLARRIRRLSTAAFACFLATGIAAWAIFLPFELPNLVRNLLGSLTFTNNILLMREAGYFAPAAASNPFLHTWSLAIEEQFYLFLPALILLTRRSARGFVLVLAAIFALSLALVLLSGEALHTREARYFAADFRIWELALGGLVAVWLSHNRPLYLPFVPLLALLAAVAPIFLIKGTPVHPGPWALLVCLGTALLLLTAHPVRSWTGRALATRVPRYLGRISYGTYLWHWPLIVFYQYLVGDLNDRSRAAFVLVAFAFGAASHHLIESPMRRLPIHANRARLFRIFLLQTALLAALAGGLHWKAQNADPAETAHFDRILEGGTIANPDWGNCWYRPDALSPCAFGIPESGTRPLILWGDSMANSALPALDTLARDAGRPGRLIAGPSCAPLLNLSRDQSNAADCLAITRETLALLADAPPSDVILFARWAYYAGGYANDLNSPEGIHPFVDADLNPVPGSTFDHFATALDGLLAAIPDQHRVILIGPAPEMPENVPFAMIRALRFGGAPAPLYRAQYESRTRRTLDILGQATTRHGIRFIDLTPDFCTESTCPAARDGIPILADQVHLSALGNDILRARLLRDLPAP